MQLRTADRLLVLFGMLGVIATQLLQLKGISRVKPDEPAVKYVDKLSLAVLQNIYELNSPLTVKEFWRRVAMLACWQVLWVGNLMGILDGRKFGRVGSNYEICAEALKLGDS